MLKLQFQYLGSFCQDSEWRNQDLEVDQSFPDLASCVDTGQSKADFICGASV